MVNKNISFGLLFVLIVSSSIFVMLPDNEIGLKVGKFASYFMINNSGNWEVVGIEKNSLYLDGLLLKAKSKDVKISYSNNSIFFNVFRNTTFNNTFFVFDKYVFDSSNNLVEFFPLEHEIRIKNGKDLIFEYKIERTGETKTENLISPYSFGKNMRLVFPSGFESARIEKGIIRIKYLIKSDDEYFNIRLYDPIPPITSLSRHYPLDDNNSLNFSELINNFFANTTFNTIIRGGKVNFSNYFNGSQQANANPPLTEKNNFTACIWFNQTEQIPNPSSVPDMFIFSRLTGSNAASRQPSLMITNRTTIDNKTWLRFGIRNSTGSASSINWKPDNNSMPLNVWFHTCGSYDGYTIRLYINGSLVGSNNSVGGILQNGTLSMRIGTQEGSTRFWIGTLDDFRIWNRTLSNDEIMDVFLIGQNLTVNSSLNGLVSNNTNSQDYEYGTSIFFASSFLNGSVNNLSIIGNLMDYSALFFLNNLTNYDFNISAENFFDNRLNTTRVLSLNLSNNSVFSWSYPFWYVPKNVSFNITLISLNSIDNLKIQLNNVFNKTLFGTLINDRLEVYNFSDGNITDLFFSNNGGFDIFYINASSIPFFNMTLNISGVNSNSEAYDKLIYLFLNNSEIENNTDFVNNTGSYPYFIIDDLTTNRGYWESNGDLTTNTYNSTTKAYELKDNMGCSPCGGGSYSLTRSGYASWEEIQIRDVDVIGINSTCTVSTTIYPHTSLTLHAESKCYLYFGTLKDGTGTNYLIDGDSCSMTGYDESGSCSKTIPTIILRRSSNNSDVWNVTRLNASFPGSFVSNITLPSSTLYLLKYASAHFDYNGFTYGGLVNSDVSFNTKGIWVGGVGAENINNNTYASNFSFISSVLANFSQNLSGAMLTMKQYNPNNIGNFSFYLSPNNGTSWENVQNNTYHSFINKGKILRFKINGSKSDSSSNFGIINVRIQVLISAASNLTFDVGADGNIDYNMSNQIINSSSILVLNGTNSSQNYVNQACLNSDSCMFPILVRSSSIGGVRLSNLTLKSKVNPIILFNNLSNVGNISLISSNNNFNITITDYKHKFIGDFDNVSLISTFYLDDGSTQNFTGLFNIRYSPFNTSTIREYFDFFIPNKTTFNVSPFGQTNNVSFWNITYLSSNHTSDFYIQYYNLTNNDCIDVWASNTSITPRINLTNTGKKILTLNSTTKGRLWNYVDFMNCTQGSEINIVINSLCSSCTLTSDYDAYDGRITE